MDDMEQNEIESAPEDCKTVFWKRYMDDVLEVIPRDLASSLTDHLNQVDPTRRLY